jgi:hypothetical protein
MRNPMGTPGPLTGRGTRVISLILGLAIILCGAATSYSKDAAPPSTPEAEPFCRFGVGIKTGESAGGFGSQFSYNFSRHWQASIGAGGISAFSWSTSSFDSRTDSYFALGRYYLDHLFFATGYSLKITQVQLERGGVFYEASRTAHGIPVYLGYEFGDRMGFFFAASAGGLWVPVNGGKTVSVTADGETVSSDAAGSGPSVGLSVGYYLW